MSKQIAAGALAVAGLAACWTAPAAPPRVVASGPAAPRGAAVAELVDPNAVVMTDTGVGPMKAMVAVSDLAGIMPGYELVAASDAAFPDFGTGEHINFMRKGERMFIAVTHGDTVFNVHTDNPRVTVERHRGWRVGETFEDSRQLSTCECWGGQAVCYGENEHVAVAFDRDCSDTVTDAELLRVFDGVTIKRLVWSPQPFGLPHADPPAKPHGGGLSGNVRAPVGGGGSDAGDDDGTGGGGDDDGNAGGGDDDDSP